MDKLHRIRLLAGDTAVAKLQSATVMVVGCGAVGSFAIEALARSGVGHIIVVDNDCIEATNINRQLFALTSTIGQPKVDIATQRIHDINPETDVMALNIFWDENTDIDVRPEFVIDAIDTVSSKIALYKWCNARKIPFISSMGAALKTDPAHVRIADIIKTSVCPLAAKIRRMVKEQNIANFPVVFSSEIPFVSAQPGKNLGSIITVTGTFGLMLANWVIWQITKHTN